MEEWGHFVAASRKIGNFDKWVVIWGVEVKDVGKVESKKISVKLVEILANLKSATPCVLLQCKPVSLIHCNRQVKLRFVFLFNFGKLELTFFVARTNQRHGRIFPQMPLLLFL